MPPTSALAFRPVTWRRPPRRWDGRTAWTVIVERGDERGRELGFPTANLRTDQWAVACRPTASTRAGSSASTSGADRLTWSRSAWRRSRSGRIRHSTVRQRRVEAYILDFDGDLYGDGLGVEFVDRLRGMERFDGVDALVEQMRPTTSKQTRALLA